MFLHIYKKINRLFSFVYSECFHCKSRGKSAYTYRNFSTMCQTQRPRVLCTMRLCSLRERLKLSGGHFASSFSQQSKNLASLVSKVTFKSKLMNANPSLCLSMLKAQKFKSSRSLVASLECALMDQEQPLSINTQYGTVNCFKGRIRKSWNS